MISNIDVSLTITEHTSIIETFSDSIKFRKFQQNPSMASNFKVHTQIHQIPPIPSNFKVDGHDHHEHSQI